MIFPAHIFLKTLTVFIIDCTPALNSTYQRRHIASFTSSHTFKDAVLAYSRRLNMGAGQVTWSRQDRVSLPANFISVWLILCLKPTRCFAKPGMLVSHLSCLGWRALCSSTYAMSFPAGIQLPCWHGLRAEFDLLLPDPQLEKPAQCLNDGCFQNPRNACLGKGMSENVEAQEHCWTPLPLLPTKNQESFVPLSSCLSESAGSCFFSKLARETRLRLKPATVAHCCDRLLASMLCYATALATHYFCERKQRRKKGACNWSTVWMFLVSSSLCITE